MRAVYLFCGCFIVFVFLSLLCLGLGVDLIVSVPQINFASCTRPITLNRDLGKCGNSYAGCLESLFMACLWQKQQT